MTRSLINRLDRIETRQGFSASDDVRQMNDAQLYAAIRCGYAALRAEHGSLAEAVRHLRTTGDTGDAALAVLIEEDIAGIDASHGGIQ